MPTSDQQQTWLLCNSFLSNDYNYHKKNQSPISNQPTLKPTTVNLIILPTFADFNVRRKIFIFLKIVNLLKNPQVDQPWTSVKKSLQMQFIFFPLKKRRIWHSCVQKTLIFGERLPFLCKMKQVPLEIFADSLCSELCIKKGDSCCNVSKEVKRKIV